MLIPVFTFQSVIFLPLILINNLVFILYLIYVLETILPPSEISYKDFFCGGF
jgi:hypothetical protein